MKKNKTTIRLLPEELTNQIAAGEVVERPASVVKELIENSIDAQATEITVIIENGGQSLISIQDDGMGISSNELELAVTRHATSKLQDIAGLSKISSYGFRGEALPSIASVSHFKIVSKARIENEQSEASELIVEFGKVQSLAPSSLQKGTLIEVRDLFFNIPARLKFLKTPATELKKASDLFIKLALVAQNVSLSLYAGTRLCYKFLAKENLKERLAHIWPPVIVDALLPVSYSNHDKKIKISGFISHPRSHQPRADRMLFYVNGRAVSDKIIMRAVRQAFHGKITTRDYPQCLLNIDLAPEDVDVNVHPAKNEVRFRDEQSVFGAIMFAVTSCLDKDTEHFSAKHLQNENYDDKQNQYVIEQEQVATNSQENCQENRLGDLYSPKPQGFWGEADKESALSFSKFLDTQKKNSLEKDSLNDWVFDDTKKECEQRILQNKRNLSEPYTDIKPLPKNFTVSENNDENNAHEKILEDSYEFQNSVDNTIQKIEQAKKQSSSLPANLVYLGQIAKTYLMIQKDADSLILLDQHAIHERILYEEVQKGLVNAQNLLMPLEFSLHKSEQKRLEEILSSLEKLSFQISFTKNTCRVFAIPENLTRVEASDFLKDVLAEKSEDLQRIWIKHACKSAIKANTELDPASALKLISKWLKTDEPDYCPHGRPCVLYFNETTLEQMFKRRA